MNSLEYFAGGMGDAAMIEITDIQAHGVAVGVASNWMVLRVSTRAGLVGWGEMTLRAHEPVLHAVVEQLRGLLQFLDRARGGGQRRSGDDGPMIGEQDGVVFADERPHGLRGYVSMKRDFGREEPGRPRNGRVNATPTGLRRHRLHSPARRHYERGPNDP
jgi:hypothetical protein